MSEMNFSELVQHRVGQASVGIELERISREIIEAHESKLAESKKWSAELEAAVLKCHDFVSDEEPYCAHCGNAQYFDGEDFRMEHKPDCIIRRIQEQNQ